MNRMSPEARALLKGVREEFEPSGADCARIDRALTARLGLAAGTLLGATTATTVSAATVGATGAAWAGASATTVAAAKWVVGALLVVSAAAGGGAVYRARERAQTPAVGGESAARPAPSTISATPATSPPSLSAVVSSNSSAPSGSEPLATPIASPEPSRAHAAPSPSASSRPVALPAPEATLGAETQILRGADQALRTGDPTRALALLDEHARSFPDGILAEERSAERVTTLCALGRIDEARAETARFLATRTGSPLAKVVRKSCGRDGVVGPPSIP